jgi:hypothetical protein
MTYWLRFPAPHLRSPQEHPLRRALLLCLLSFASAATTSAQKPELRPHHVEKEWKRNEQTPPSTGYFCNSTKPNYPNGYPHLSIVPRTDGLAEYRGTLITWTPNDNVTECHVRQLYFWVNTIYQASPSVDVNIEMTRHGSTTVIKQRLNWDIISIQYPGATIFRVDAEQVDNPASPDGLQGDYDFVIDVIGTPAASAHKQH